MSRLSKRDQFIKTVMDHIAKLPETNGFDISAHDYEELKNSLLLANELEAHYILCRINSPRVLRDFLTKALFSNG